MLCSSFRSSAPAGPEAAGWGQRRYWGWEGLPCFRTTHPDVNKPACFSVQGAGHCGSGTEQY